jgi:hypothetical protein
MHVPLYTDIQRYTGNCDILINQDIQLTMIY